LATYFHEADTSTPDLEKWYADEIVPHRRYRDHVKIAHSVDAAGQLAKHYRSLSRFAHRSYRAILDGYLRGGEDPLVHDRTSELFGGSKGAAKSLVLPQTIASYYAVLGNLTLEYVAVIAEL